MNLWRAERDEIAGKLAAAGVAAVTLDPRAPLPCVLVGPVRITEQGPARRFWSCEIPVEIVAAPPGGVDALDWLETQLELVCRTLNVSDAVPGPVTRNDADCPAYTVTVARDVTNPDC